jgi:hypothetical protein
MWLLCSAKHIIVYTGDRLFKQKVEGMASFQSHLCPSCPSASSSECMVLSVDATFRLCRRKNAAKIDTAPPLLQQFFLPQADVDVYVQSRDGSNIICSGVCLPILFTNSLY